MLSHPPSIRSVAGSRWLTAALLVAAVVFVYAGSLRAPFIFDDYGAILNNRTIHQLWSWDIFRPPAYGGTTTGRPLVNATFALNYAISQDQVWSYHALNLALHVLSTLIVLGLGRRTLSLLAVPSAEVVAFAGTALWALHPLLTETVVCIAQRTELLCSFFYLLTLYAFVRGSAAPASSRAWFTLSVAAALAGMATKEVMVTAPLVVWLYDRTFVAKSFSAAWATRRGYYVALAGSWLLLAALVASGGGTRGAAAGFGLGVSPWDYLLTQADALVLYLRLAFWPHPLVLDYGTAVRHSLTEVWWQGLVVLMLLAATGWALVRQPRLGFLGAWFFLLLGPSSSVIPLVEQTIAEHRMYLPLLAVLAVGTVGVHRWLGSWAVPALLGLALLGGGATVARNRDYTSALTIWRTNVTHRPHARALNNLALVLATRPESQSEAVACYEEALRLKPNYADAHYNLADLLAKLPGRQGDAIAHYEEAVRLSPDYAEAHNNVANLLATIPARQQDAVAHFAAAVRLLPDYSEIHFNFALVLARMPERRQEAVTHYETALRLKPDYARAHFNFALLLAEIPSRHRDALDHLETAVRLLPDNATVHFRLAQMLEEFPGRADEARAHYAIARRIDPALGAAAGAKP